MSAPGAGSMPNGGAALAPAMTASVSVSPPS